MLKHKFKAKQTLVDDIKFPSKAEARRYAELKAMQKNGIVLFFLRQVPFHLPGGVKYVCDFLVFWSDGSCTVEDVKGMKTPLYKLKKKQVEAIYPIEVTEIT
jgi:hypothetical protein